MFRRGDEVFGMYFILEGQVILSINDCDLLRYSKDSIIGLNMLIDHRSHYTATTAEEIICLKVNLRALKRLLRRYKGESLRVRVLAASLRQFMIKVKRDAQSSMLRQGLSLSKPPEEGYRVTSKQGMEFRLDTFEHAESLAQQIIENDAESVFDEGDSDSDDLSSASEEDDPHDESSDSSCLYQSEDVGIEYNELDEEDFFEENKDAHLMPDLQKKMKFLRSQKTYVNFGKERVYTSIEINKFLKQVKLRFLNTEVDFQKMGKAQLEEMREVNIQYKSQLIRLQESTMIMNAIKSKILDHLRQESFDSFGRADSSGSVGEFLKMRKQKSTSSFANLLINNLKK